MYEPTGVDEVISGAETTGADGRIPAGSAAQLALIDVVSPNVIEDWDQLGVTVTITLLCSRWTVSVSVSVFVSSNLNFLKSAMCSAFVFEAITSDLVAGVFAVVELFGFVIFCTGTKMRYMRLRAFAGN